MEPRTEIELRKRDAYSSLQSIERIISTGILSSNGMQSPFFRPCITQILIELSDVLKIAVDIEKRVSFTDDVLTSKRIADVTDLIRESRNACCHISSGNHKYETNKFVFNVVAGRMPNAIVINDVSLGSDYEDDICVLWGASVKLYLRRHFLRAYQEALALFPDPWGRS